MGRSRRPVCQFRRSPGDGRHPEEQNHRYVDQGAGGWVYEWSAIAADYAAKSDHTMASLVYGFAKFPTVCDQQRVVALQKQVDEFIKAAPTFPVHFERRTMTLPYAGSTVDFPVHVYPPTRIMPNDP